MEVSSTRIVYRGHEIEISGFAGDHIFRAIETSGTFYEVDLLDYIRRCGSRLGLQDRVTVDAGANIGNHSVFFANFVSSTVISVEPNPQTFAVLSSNLDRLNASCLPFMRALGSAESYGTILHHDEDSDLNVGMAQVKVDGIGSVPIGTLDALVEEAEVVGEQRGVGRRKVGLIKIDVEGAELSVLQGASKTLVGDQPELIIEAQTEAEETKLSSWLQQYGYRRVGFRWAATPTYHYSTAPFRTRLGFVLDGVRIKAPWLLARIRARLR